jgi:hypothetical protein
MVVEAETVKLKKFQQFLPVDDQIAFHDLLLECRLYAPYAGVMASPVKEFPLLISMLFGQHKRILDLEKKIVTLETVMKKNRPVPPDFQTPSEMDRNVSIEH